MAQVIRASHACTHEMLRHDASWSEVSDDFSECDGGCMRSGGDSSTAPGQPSLPISRPSFQHAASLRYWPDCRPISGFGNNWRGCFPGLMNTNDLEVHAQTKSAALAMHSEKRTNLSSNTQRSPSRRIAVGFGPEHCDWAEGGV